jgi:type I restriction enzyme, S subunit
MNSELIGNLVIPAKQCAPVELGREWISYLDIAAIDNEAKQVVAPQRLRAETAPSRARQVVHGDDVLVSTVRPNLNAVAVVPKQLDGEFASTGFCVLRPDRSRVDTRYLFYFAQTAPFIHRLTKAASGASYPAVTDSDILETPIPLPALPEQQRISTMLEQADRARRTRRYALELSDTFLPALFLELFGDPVRNPKGWHKKPLGEVCGIRRGASPRPIERFLGGSVPWVKIGDGTRGDQIYIASTQDHVTEEGAAKSVFLKKNSLIFANCGVSCGFARILKIDGCIHDGWLAFFDFEKTLDPLFFLQAINQITLHLRSLAPEGTQPNLNTGIMSAFPMIVPPLKMQQHFARLGAVHEQQRRYQREALRQADHLFQSLLHRTFS